jgi:hypothetical protein
MKTCLQRGGPMAAAGILLLVVGTGWADDGDLTGRWHFNDDATCFVRQIGDQLWWVAKSKDGGRSWTQVFHGKITGRQLTGHFADVPEGANRYQGSVTARLIVRDGAVVEIKGEMVFSPSNDRAPLSIKRHH